MKAVKFDNVKYIHYEINPTIKNIWYNDRELKRMNNEFLQELKVISYLHSCALPDGLRIWKKALYD
jgi:hypothetical protein